MKTRLSAIVLTLLVLAGCATGVGVGVGVREQSVASRSPAAEGCGGIFVLAESVEPARPETFTGFVLSTGKGQINVAQLFYDALEDLGKFEVSREVVNAIAAKLGISPMPQPGSMSRMFRSMRGERPALEDSSGSISLSGLRDDQKTLLAIYLAGAKPGERLPPELAKWFYLKRFAGPVSGLALNEGSLVSDLRGLISFAESAVGPGADAAQLVAQAFFARVRPIADQSSGATLLRASVLGKDLSKTEREILRSVQIALDSDRGNMSAARLVATIVASGIAESQPYAALDQLNAFAGKLTAPVASAADLEMLWRSAKNVKAREDFVKAFFDLPVDPKAPDPRAAFYLDAVRRCETKSEKKQLLTLLASRPEALGGMLGTMLETSGSQGVAEILPLVREIPDPKVNDLLFGFFKANHERLDDRLRGDFEGIGDQFGNHVLVKLMERLRMSLSPDEALVSEILSRQSSVEKNLKDDLENVIKANAPPAPFNGMSRPWALFLKNLPQRLRREFTAKLLERNSGNTTEVTRIVAALDPIDGVRQAVATFIGSSRFMNSNRGDFSHEQISAMFGGDRFAKFFPWMVRPQLDDAPRTQLIVGTHVNSVRPIPLNAGWLYEKLVDQEDAINRGVARGFGFRPALDHSRLQRMLNDRLVSNINVGAPAQVRGLTVQSAYEQQGSSFMRRASKRGDFHIETVAPGIREGIEANLNSGQLATESRLVQRLFVTGWYVHANSSLITRIRDRAIWIANNASGFWQIRVEIHNFPTLDVLRRTREFAATGTGQVREQLDILVREIEQLLTTGDKGQIEEMIKGLPDADAANLSLLPMVQGFEGKAPVEQLGILSALREKWLATARDSNQAAPKAKTFVGDKTISGSATAVAHQAVDAMVRDRDIDGRRAAELGLAVMDHLRLDDCLSADQVGSVKSSIDSILADGTLTEIRKLELVANALQSSVEQIRFRLVREYGRQDAMVSNYFRGHAHSPATFVDSTLRAGNASALSKLVDGLLAEVASRKNVVHRVAGSESRAPIEVFNPGRAEGKLRFNPDPMTLNQDEIAVFETLPAESAALGGVITIGAGARLSHLQLLAKSIGVPNVKVTPENASALKALDGQWVRLEAGSDGAVSIESSEVGATSGSRSARQVDVPEPNLSRTGPIAFGDYSNAERGAYAGPKGANLAKMFQSAELAGSVPDGFILPFGFFDRYAQAVGLKPWLELLSKVELKNTMLVSFVTGKIERIVAANAMPTELLDEAMAALDALYARTGHQGGSFVRSDTNIEDLENFNGAGLNESVANIPRDRAALDKAIRRVWASPFTEKSIFWRGTALGKSTVTVALPSVVVMPTVTAKSSGVLLTKGGPDWQEGRGMASANWGIGSVVEAGDPVEEVSFEGQNPIRYGWTVAASRPVPNPQGGLSMEPVVPGAPVLSPEDAGALRQMGASISNVLGDQPHGWDVEWVFDQNGKRWVLQARPNM